MLDSKRRIFVEGSEHNVLQHKEVAAFVVRFVYIGVVLQYGGGRLIPQKQGRTGV